MAPQAHRYDPKNPHRDGCKRLCCNRDGIYLPGTENQQSIVTPKLILYTIGIATILGLGMAYCMKKQGESRLNTPVELSQKLN